MNTYNELPAEIIESLPSILNSGGFGFFELKLDESAIVFHGREFNSAVFGENQPSVIIDWQEYCAYYVHADDLAGMEASVAESLDLREKIEYRNRVLDHAKRWRWMKIHAIPPRNPEDKAIYGIMRDITEQSENELLLKSLTETETRIHTMLDATPLACAFVDEELNIIDCNEEAVRLGLFASKANYLNHYRRNYPPFQPDGMPSLAYMNNMLVEAFKSGRETFEFTYALPDGENVPCEIVFKRMKWQSGYRIVAFARDLRELRKAELEIAHQQRLLHAVNEVAHLLMWVGSEDFHELVDTALKKLAECVGVERVSIWRNFTDGNRQLCARRVGGWLKGIPLEADPQNAIVNYKRLMPEFLLEDESRDRVEVNDLVKNLRKPVRDFPLLKHTKSVLVIPLKIQSKFWGFIGFSHQGREYVFTDAEKSILRSGGMLIASAIERGRITREMVRAKEEAQENARAKSDFLSRMSHEIRTPMNAIIGMTDLALKARDMNTVQEYLGKIETSSSQLLGLINDVLDMAKIEADKLEIDNRPFDFEAMLRGVLDVIMIRASEKRQRLFVDMDMLYRRRIISDELRLSQVLMNLLSNAVKFTPAGGEIVLRIRETSLGKNTFLLRVDVVDNGIGISADNLPRMFQSFEQGDNSITRKYGGTGLGLAISKRIVNLMGGNIRVMSEVGRGTRFSFDVKVSWGRGLPEIPANVPPRRALVYSRHGKALDMITAPLHDMGVGYTVCKDTAELFEKLESTRTAPEKYDVVMSSWSAGETWYDRLVGQAAELWGDTRVVAVVSAEDRKKAELSDIRLPELFVVKPALPSEIYRALRSEKEKKRVAVPVAVEAETADWSDKTLLLVEDNEINRELLLLILEETGIRIDSAENGELAVGMFRARQYDLVFMDMQMPVMDGLDATRMIREGAESWAGSVPIVAMTANAFSEDKKACLEAGMNDYISKPYEATKIFAIMRKYLNK